MRRLTHLPLIVLAPLAGGPSTPELAAAVSNAGGLGFLGAGYLTADDLRARIRRTRELTSALIAVNLFVVTGEPAPPEQYQDYVDSLRPEAERLGVEVGTPRFDDDELDAKLGVVLDEDVDVVSLTFGLPPADAIERLRAAGRSVWITAATPGDARAAEGAGADVLVLQGAEAGGHRGTFVDDDSAPMDLLSLVQSVRAESELPIVAAGGIATAADVRTALDVGASAAQVGTAFMLAPEAGTSDAHRDAIASDTPTALTRAFTGRLARGICNRFMDEHPEAPSAYPEIHYATAPIRAAARKARDPSVVNLWAGQSHHLAVARPAAETVAALTP